MTGKEIDARYREVDSKCMAFISESLGLSILDGDTDAEFVDDVPEVRNAEKISRREDKSSNGGYTT